MDVAMLLHYLAAQFPLMGSVLVILGLLVVVGQAVVVITPSKKDDEAWAKLKALPLIGPLLDALSAFAPLQKK